MAIPIAAVFSYYMALNLNLDASYIDTNGSAVGVILVVASVFGISRIADDERWTDRAGTALALAAAYFALTWVRYGDPTLSADAQPHIVWFGFCVVAFTPAVVLIPASKWAWSVYRSRTASNVEATN